jgi:hypothetical protein
MGLNPYFNESQSNLGYHEVQARLENNSNVYERGTAHWFAIANARSLGKPTTYSATSEIFKTSHPGQLRLPRYVDPLADKWTNVHYTNEAIVGSDNVPNAMLNYEDWHQGLGLTSISDEKYIASMRSVQHTDRIENLKALRAGETIPDVRRFQNTRAASAIISATQKLKQDLESSTYLPKDNEEPTEEQRANIQVFNDTVGSITQAYVGFSYGTQEERDAVLVSLRSLFSVDRKSDAAQRTKRVGSALANLAAIVGSRPISALPPSTRAPDNATSAPSGPPQTAPTAPTAPPAMPSSTESLQPGAALANLAKIVTAQPVAEVPAPASVPTAETAPVPVTESAAATVEPVSVAPSATEPAAATIEPESVAPSVSMQPTDASTSKSLPSAAPMISTTEASEQPSLPAKLPAGEILNLNVREILALTPAQLDVGIGELEAMDSSQFAAFSTRYSQLLNQDRDQIPLNLRRDPWYSAFYRLRQQRNEEKRRRVENPGSDYYGENISPLTRPFREPILKRDEQRHRQRQGGAFLGNGDELVAPKLSGGAPLIHGESLVGGMPGRRRGSVAPVPTAAPTLPAPEPTVAPVQNLSDHDLAIIAEAIQKASTKLQREAIQAVAAQTKKKLEENATKRSASVPETRPQRDISQPTVGVKNTVGTNLLSTVTTAGISALGAGAMMMAMGTGPDKGDFNAAEGILTPVLTIAERTMGAIPATVIGIAGSVGLPIASWYGRQRMGMYTVKSIIDFVAGDTEASASGIFAGIYDMFATGIERIQGRSGRMNANMKIQSAVNEGKQRAADKLQMEIVQKAEIDAERDIRKRFGLSDLPTPGAPMRIVPSTPSMTTTQTSAPTSASQEATVSATPSTAAMPTQQAFPTVQVPARHMGGNRYVRGDLTKEERRMQSMLGKSKERMAEELDSDSDGMDMEGGVLENKTDIISSMGFKGNLSHRVPEGDGDKLPTLYGGVMREGDLAPSDVEMLGDIYASALEVGASLHAAGTEFDPVQLGEDAYDNYMTELLSSSSADRLIVVPPDAPHAPPAEVDYTNFPIGTSDVPAETIVPVEGLLSGGTLTGVKRSLEAEAAVESAAKRMELEGGNLFKSFIDSAANTVSGIVKSAISDPSSSLKVAEKLTDLYNAPDSNHTPGLKDLNQGLNSLTGKKSTTKREFKGGEKVKRKVSEWSLLIQKVYKEMKETDPNVTIAMAAKEASRRRKNAT